MRYFSILRYLAISLVLLCSACGTALPTVKPYKLDVQQGNVVTSKMLLQLRPGMTKSQVRFIMGTPLIQDSFHGNRWDYVYQMREGGKVTEQRRVILDFENELLKSVRGDVIPAGSDASQPEASQAKTGTRVVEPYKKPEEKSLMSKLKFWEKDESALTKEVAEKEAAAKAEAEAKLKAEAAAKSTIVPAEQAPALADASAMEEPKSILAVPLEAAPVIAAPPVEVVQPAIPGVSIASSAPVIEAPKAEAPIVEPPSEAMLPKVTEPAPVADVTPDAAKVPVYASASGMIFDRNLRFVPEELAQPVKAAEVLPRAGNKEIPQPKALPAENEPGFFDRMLEKIGF